MNEFINLTLYEFFALIGLFQSVAVIVYIGFRAGHVRHVAVPFLVFSVFSLCFLSDFGGRFLEDYTYYRVLQAGVWMCVPAFSVLLIAQIADLGKFPRPVYWLTLLFPLLSNSTGWVVGAILSQEDCLLWSDCNMDARIQLMRVFGIVLGVISLSFLWFGRGAFESLHQDKQTRGDRYWLILSLFFMNLLLLGAVLLQVSGGLDFAAYQTLRNLVGGGMVYLASTSLFRIYPQSVHLVPPPKIIYELSEGDKVLIEKIQSLLELDKVYQETNFSRADLARELGISEARASKLVNMHFGKTLPQVVNELRVRDSLQLLNQTDVQVTVIAEEVGFNSVPTFNRVFKEIMNESPTDYRQKNKKTAS